MLLCLALAAPVAQSCAADGPNSAMPVSAVPVSAVLVAGDPSLPVFDNATQRMERDLAHGGAQVERLSGQAQPNVALATPANVLAAIARMHPPPGGSCLVFATSHGVHGAGLYLAASDDVLAPAALDRALRQGCGEAPTVVVISACYSGLYARPPVARGPNRIVFTAARADRPSFGCGADRAYTFFDECLLAAIERDPTWNASIADTRGCVAETERRDNERPSLPQVFVGGAMGGFPASGFTP